MIVSANWFRPAVSKTSLAVCSRCLRKVAPPARRTFSSSPSPQIPGSILPPRTARNTLKNDYFSGNGLLVQVAQRGRFASNAVQSQAAGSGAVKGQNTANADGKDTAEIIEGTQKTGPSLDHIPPHRRRKLRKSEAAEAADSSTAAYPIAPDASAQLSNLSSTLPVKSFRRAFAVYLSLTKPRLSFLVVLTSTVAYTLYPVPALLSTSITEAPSLSTLTLLFLTSGTALCAGAANAFNMIIEPAHDAKMSRTRNRPLVRKLVSRKAAIIFAIAMSVGGVGSLYYGVNPTAAFLGAANIFLYAGVYTPMKRMTVINTWVGSLVGAIPPLMGWAAAAGQYASENGTWRELLASKESVGGWLLAALLFAWQFPHFNALSWAIREEYKHAGYRMLCWTNPAMNGRVALRYSILLFPITIGLSYIGVTDWGFAFTSSLVNGWMAYESVRFWREQGHKGTARALFWASVWHLPIVLVLAMAHKKGLWDRIYRGLTGQTAPAMYDDEEWEEEDEEEEDDEQSWEGKDKSKPQILIS